MKNRYYKTPYIGSAFTDFDGVLRYLRGKDQELINEDDPDFFAIPDNRSNAAQLQRHP